MLATNKKKSFATPDETAKPTPRVTLETVRFGDMSVTRMIAQPGWKWSEDIKPLAGTDSCQGSHFSYVISGRFRSMQDDGTVVDLGPGDIAITTPGHDAMVIGDEPCVILDFQEASRNS